MPFDGTPLIHPAKSPGGAEPNLAEVGASTRRALDRCLSRMGAEHRRESAIR